LNTFAVVSFAEILNAPPPTVAKAALAAASIALWLSAFL